MEGTKECRLSYLQLYILVLLFGGLYKILICCKNLKGLNLFIEIVYHNKSACINVFIVILLSPRIPGVIKGLLAEVSLMSELKVFS